jgi:AcrR family transcriptional regulator
VRATVKLSSEQRRAAIIGVAKKMFANNGFDRTTTRQLAQTAGISEALLYKHFPTKEALFLAMQQSCQYQNDPAIERLKALEPSTSTLVVMVHYFVHKMAGREPSRDEDDDESMQFRLTLRSLMEDGEFARLQVRERSSCWIGKVVDCLKAAIAAGDAANGPMPADLRAWFAHHLAVTLKIYLRPQESIVDYKLPREKLVEYAVWFALRGMGMKDEAIKRYYNPKALALLVK